MRAQGFDTSRHNHPGDLPINFQIAYDAGYSFWCGRLSVGNYYIDPWIVRDYQVASLTPFVKAVYHVPRSGYDTPSQVAKVREGLALLPSQPRAIVLDMEGEDGLYSRADITNCLGEHVQQIRSFWMHKIILYLNLNYLTKVLLDTFGLDIWISWPGVGGAYNPNPNPPVAEWRQYQRSFTHTIPGHPDLTVDLDEFNGDDAAMQAYFEQDEPPPPAEGEPLYRIELLGNLNVRRAAGEAGAEDPDDGTILKGSVVPIYEEIQVAGWPYPWGRLDGWMYLNPAYVKKTTKT